MINITRTTVLASHCIHLARNCLHIAMFMVVQCKKLKITKQAHTVEVWINIYEEAILLYGAYKSRP